MESGFFTTSDGQNVYYSDIGHAIDVLHPRFRNRHMYDQLKVLGLFNTFLQSETPCALPQTFTAAKRRLAKTA